LLSSVDVGEFRLQLDNGIFNITHKRDQYARSLLASPAGGDPLITAEQVHTDWSDHDGMFSHKEKLKDSCLSLTELALTEQGLSGNLCNHTMTLTWRVIDFRQLSLSATISDPSAYNRVTIKLESPSDEVIIGLGAQYSRFNLKGSRFLAMSTEQGVGRGLQPITAVLNRVHHGAGGDFQTTYTYAGHYITSRLQSVMLTTEQPAWFDFGTFDENQTSIQIASSSLEMSVFWGDNPTSLVEAATSVTGRMKPLPRWLTSGAVLGLEGGQKAVSAVLDQIQTFDADLPISALWLQDWTGEREFVDKLPLNHSYIDRVGLWWNWEIDESYAGFQDWIKQLRDEKGIRMMTYINPMLTDVKAQGKANFTRNFFQEAKALDYLVKDLDGQVVMPYGSGLINLIDPKAVEWAKQSIKTQMLDTGVVGWMNDFGEAMPINAQLPAGTGALEFHNQYPTLWARAAREAIQEAGLEGEAMFFSRSRGLKGPSYTPLYWNGDQLPTFDSKDGLKSSVTAMLSGGVSGMAMTHSDTGGYTAVHFPGATYDRSEELLNRWCEVSAFTAIYRTHIGTLPSSLQVYSNNATLTQFAKFAKVYASWGALREELMVEAALMGTPLARAMFFHFPDVAEAWTVEDQWMLGPELLIAPVMDSDVTVRRLWLPPTNKTWRHLWTGQEVAGGQYYSVNASVGEPPVFTQQSVLVDLFLAELRMRKVIA